MRARSLAAMLCILCMAFVVQPAEITVDASPGESFSHVVTLINDDPQPRNVRISIDPFSAYLEDSVTLSENNFFLRPEESANLQITGMVPSLGPETHILEYAILAEQNELSRLRIEIPIEGEPDTAPRLAVDVAETVHEGSVLVNASLRNFGNTITYWNVSLVIREGGEAVGKLRVPGTTQVLPGEEENLGLLYTDFLEPGQYEARVEATVNGDIQLGEGDEFRLLLRDQEYAATRGDDLQVQLKRYTDTPTVSYSIKQGSVLILQNTVLLRSDTLTIPTRALEPGDYKLDITVQHGSGTDDLSVNLIIEEQAHIPWLPWIGLFILIIGLISAKPIRTQVRLVLLERRVRKKEKQLNELLHETYQLVHGN